MDALIYAILSTILVSSVALIGIFTLHLKKDSLHKILLFLVSLSVGALLGDAFIHLLPEAFETIGLNVTTSLLIISGMLLFFVIEKFLRWRHCHDDTCKEHLKPVVVMNLVGDFVHNLIDGMLIGASYVVSIPLGIATTIAVLLHEIPQEIGDFGVLVQGGLEPKKALLLNFASASAAILGAIIAVGIGTNLTWFSQYLIPITAGGFLYIAGSDLIPELHHETNYKKSILQFGFILLGILAMLLIAD
jgi:zinc and cadmium transporter